MGDYDNTNKGIIGKNTRKEKDTHPDLSGSINVDGKDYWLSGWKKTRNDGTGTFYSLSVKAKDDRPVADTPVQARAEAKAVVADDSDVPF